jgi:hypothetical protein
MALLETFFLLELVLSRDKHASLFCVVASMRNRQKSFGVEFASMLILVVSPRAQAEFELKHVPKNSLNF